VLSLVASKTGNVIIIMDAQGNFEWVNEGFINRYGMTLEEFINAKGKNLVENSSYSGISDIFKQLKENRKAVSYTARRKLGNKDILWSQTTISPVLDEKGDIIRLIAIDSDITRLKSAEEQIEKQRDELKHLNATKDKFFSIIAHDLKNPFHSIMGFSDLLTRSYEAIEEEKKKEFIKLINDSSTSAYGLLENLLNWARTQTNRIKYNPSQIDISIITREVFQMLSVIAENKKVQLQTPEDFKEVYAYADYNMVYTVFRNLINNALKFTESGGKVSVDTSIIKDRIEIVISDTGIGMTEEEKSKLFKLDEFHTTTGTSGEAGTGLGLIVCREFILIHGGDIEIESQKGKGSSFKFTLPLKKTKTK
jgi:PAS domain S-box-containing protein